MHDGRQRTAVDDFLDRLSRAPASVLLLDYDGTLAPFQTRRDQAYPYPEVIPILERILQNGRTRVVIISGRPVREVQALLGSLDQLEIWGAHGLEHALTDGTYRKIALDASILAVLDEARKWAITSGLASLLETKPGGIAIHWRGKPDSEIERIQALTSEGWTAFADQTGLKILHFDGGLELRASRPDKGDAVVTLIEEAGPSASIAFLGDDLTDEDAFRALKERGLSVLVRSEYRATQADVWLRPPHELVVFLEQWLRNSSSKSLPPIEPMSAD